MVEAVIVIPVLLLIWASLYYLGDLFSTQQALESKARSCAWIYSANNCQAVPAGCEGVVTPAEGSTDDVAPEVTGALEDGALAAVQGRDSQGIVGTVVGDLVAGPLLAAFTTSAEAKATRDVKQPAAFGSGIKTVTGRYHLACNLAPTTPKKMAEDAWSSLVP